MWTKTKLIFIYHQKLLVTLIALAINNYIDFNSSTSPPGALPKYKFIDVIKAFDSLQYIFECKFDTKKNKEFKCEN